MLGVIVDNKLIDYIDENNIHYVKYDYINKRYVDCNAEESEGFSCCNGEYYLNFPESKRLINGLDCKFVEVDDAAHLIYISHIGMQNLQEELKLINTSLMDTIQLYEKKIGILENSIAELTETIEELNMNVDNNTNTVDEISDEIENIHDKLDQNIDLINNRITDSIDRIDRLELIV